MENKKTEDYLCKWVHNRTHIQDLDALICMVGARGSCKSGSSLSLAYKIDRDKNGNSRFSMKKPKGFRLKRGEVMPRVVFTPTDFLNVVKEKLPKGSCIIFDEVGVAGDSREFMSKKNRMLKQVMETIRSRNLVIFMTAPTLGSFDSGFRRVMSLYVHCRGKATSTQGYPCALVFPRVGQTDPNKGDVYFKPVTVINKVKGKAEALNKVYVERPPAFIEEPYKRYKLFMQQRLYETYSQKMGGEDTYNVTKAEKNKTNNDYVRELMINATSFFDVKKKKFVMPLIQEHFDLRPVQTRELKQVLEFRFNRGDFPRLTALVKEAEERNS